MTNDMKQKTYGDALLSNNRKLLELLSRNMSVAKCVCLCMCVCVCVCVCVFCVYI